MPPPILILMLSSSKTEGLSISYVNIFLFPIWSNLMYISCSNPKSSNFTCPFCDRFLTALITVPRLVRNITIFCFELSFFFLRIHLFWAFLLFWRFFVLLFKRITTIIIILRILFTTTSQDNEDKGEPPLSSLSWEFSSKRLLKIMRIRVVLLKRRTKGKLEIKECWIKRDQINESSKKGSSKQNIMFWTNPNTVIKAITNLSQNERTKVEDLGF